MDVELRPLRAEDADAFSNAFSAIGWSKPSATFQGYLEEQNRGLRWVRVVEVGGGVAGYITLRWVASDPAFRSMGVPEIMDLNVLPSFRRRGLGTALLAAAEAESARRSSMVGLRMGLHSGYGAAQRLYAERGYVPDGAGALAGAEVVAEGAVVRIDDDLTLRLLKKLSSPGSEALAAVGMRKGAGIEVRLYDPSWPRAFEVVRQELLDALPSSILSVEHVGSTSVPGLDAKPIIDVLVGVTDLAGALAHVPILESLGFEYRPKDDLPDRHYFPRSNAELRLHHVSLAEPGSRYFHNTRLFRDVLRADPGIAREYATLKRRLAQEVGTVRLAYLNGKTDFILAVLQANGGILDGDYPTSNLGSSAV